DHHVPRAGGERNREDRVPAVPDRTDGAADRDPPASGDRGDGAGAGDPPAGRGDLAFPLAGVEGDRSRGQHPAEPGGDGVDPPRPGQRRQPQPGRDRRGGQQQERPGQAQHGQVGPALFPVSGRGQRGRPPSVRANGQGDQPDGGDRQGGGGGAAQ